MISLLRTFPDRPLRLAPPAFPRRPRWYLGLVGLALLIFTLVRIWLLVDQFMLRHDLNSRGVEVGATYPTHHCWHSGRTGRGPLVCDARARYQPGPSDGGGIREADVHFERVPDFSRQPPPVTYDSANPGRVMPTSELGSWPDTTYFALILLGLLLAVMTGPHWLLDRTKWRRALSDSGLPTLLEILQLTSNAQGNYLITFKDPKLPALHGVTFGSATPPFLVTQGLPSAGLGTAYVLALKTDEGRLYPLDAGLTFLELTEQERARVLGLSDVERGHKPFDGAVGFVTPHRDDDSRDILFED